jgi:hypothetical protein
VRLEHPTQTLVPVTTDEDAHAATPSAMELHLARMLDTLVQLGIAHG